MFTLKKGKQGAISFRAACLQQYITQSNTIFTTYSQSVMCTFKKTQKPYIQFKSLIAEGMKGLE